MDVIFLLGASQAAFLSFLVFNKKDKSHGDFVLGAWLAFIGLHLLDYYFFATGLNLKYPHLLAMGEFFPLLQGPFMYVYVLLVISQDGRIKPIHFLNALPFVAIVCYFIFDFYILDAETKKEYYLQLAEEPNTALMISVILDHLLGPCYVVLSLIKLRRHEKNISNRFSYTEEIDLKWLKYILAGLGTVWLVVLISYIMDFLGEYDQLGNQMIYGSLTVAVFFLGYFGIKQNTIYTPVQLSATPMTPEQNSTSEKDKTDAGRYKNSGLRKADAERYLNDLLEYMDNEKPYLDGKLSLKDVATHLGISVNHLSQVINEQLQKSFFDFVNTYRVEEVKRLLNESRHEQLTLLAVAYDSGFNSKSSFNSIFKKLTGMTPSEYVKHKSDQILKS